MLLAEVQHLLDRELTEEEARRIEVPATASLAEFDKWSRGRKRTDLTPLSVGSQLLTRLRDLQPFRRRDTENHPMKVLAEHTNLAKHRTPSVAATRLAAVVADNASANLITPSEPKPVAAGDIIATGPLYERVPLSIWPTISIQRPHTGTWHTVMNELGEIETWVRTVAIPHLILGRSDVEPLPPHVDASVGHDTFEAAFATARNASAAERSMVRVQAVVARESLVDMLASGVTRPNPTMPADWVATLDDSEVLERQDRLHDALKVRDTTRIPRVVGTPITGCRSHRVRAAAVDRFGGGNARSQILWHHNDGKIPKDANPGTTTAITEPGLA